MEEVQKQSITNAKTLKFVVFSLLGLFAFFFPLSIGARKTIPVDHIVTYVRSELPRLAASYVIIIMAWGIYTSFREKRWSRSTTDCFFSFFNLIGFVIGCAVYFKVGPGWLLVDNMAPYVFELVAIPVALVIPIGSIFLVFLTGFGLLEFVGEMMVPIMRPVFHLPGRSAIDAVASFVGSYSIGLIITNNIYKNGGYSAREATIIATGFSTVSVSFMMITAKTLGLMEYWGFYFWITLVVTFLVSALTVRVPPLSRIPDTLYSGHQKIQAESISGFSKIFGRAWMNGVKAAAEAPKLSTMISANLIDGIRMARGVAAAILSFGVIALLLAEYTPIFHYTGYIFYPFFKLLQLPDALIAGQAASVSIADMFTPAVLCKEAALVTRFTIGVLCISEVLFFSGMLPCLFGTDIPINMKDVFIVWFERVVFSILLTAPIAHLLFS